MRVMRPTSLHLGDCFWQEFNVKISVHATKLYHNRDFPQLLSINMFRPLRYWNKMPAVYGILLVIYPAVRMNGGQFVMTLGGCR